MDESVNVCLKHHDLFGKKVGLTLKGEGDTVNTVCGGFFSLLIKAFAIWFGVVQIVKMADFTNAQTGSLTSVTDFEYLGNLSLSDNGVMLILQKWDMRGGLQPILDKHDSIVHFYAHGHDEFQSDVIHSFRTCEFSDFEKAGLAEKGLQLVNEGDLDSYLCVNHHGDFAMHES